MAGGAKVKIRSVRGTLLPPIMGGKYLPEKVINQTFLVFQPDELIDEEFDTIIYLKDEGCWCVNSIDLDYLD